METARQEREIELKALERELHRAWWATHHPNHFGYEDDLADAHIGRVEHEIATTPDDLGEVDEISREMTQAG